jgi:hypothetical protein
VPEKTKLDQILETLTALAERISRTEADAARALESANTVARATRAKPGTPAPADNSGGLGFTEALRLMRETEDRTTDRLTRFLEIANTSQKSTQDSFMRGLNLGRELAAMDVDGDGEPDGMEYVSEIVGLVRDLLIKKKGNGAAPADADLIRGVIRGLQSGELSDQGGKDAGDPGSD